MSMLGSGAYPPFTMAETRFDQDTFWGRVQTMVGVFNPLTLLRSADEIERCSVLLENWKAKQPDARALSDQELWDARALVESAVHPETGELIPRLFRMAAIAPSNIPIIAAMLSTSSVPMTLFLQVVNQSYNSGCNYFNRSGAESSNTQLAQSYALAVGVSCAIAYGMSRLVARKPFLQKFGFVVPYTAVACAGACNIGFMRFNEITDGINVSDADGNVVGVSKKAGFSAVMQTAVSRGVISPLPALCLPDLVMKGIGALGFLPQTRIPLLMLQCATIYTSFSFGLPVALALFPQKAEFDVTDLEADFQGLRDKNGEPIRKLFANKGL